MRILFDDCQLGREHLRRMLQQTLQRLNPWLNQAQRLLQDPNFSEVRLRDGQWDRLLAVSDGSVWEDLIAVAKTHSFLWVTNEVCIIVDDSIMDILSNCDSLKRSVGLQLKYDGGDENQHVYICSAVDDTGIEPTQVLQNLFRLLAMKPATEIQVRGMVMSAEALASFLEGNHQSIGFYYTSFSEEQCRQLATYRGSLFVHDCLLGDEGASLCQGIAQNSGPAELQLSHLTLGPPSLAALASAIRSNLCSLRLLRVHGCNGFLDNIIFDALQQNIGLRALHIENVDCYYEFWDVLFASVKRHPTLEDLVFEVDLVTNEGRLAENDTSERKRRSQIISAALQENFVLTTVEVRDEHVDEEIFNRQIVPRLEANLFRPRVERLRNEEVKSVQSGVFAKALTVEKVNNSPTNMWLFVSKFPEVLCNLYYQRSTKHRRPVTTEAAHASKKARTSRV